MVVSIQPRKADPCFRGSSVVVVLLHHQTFNNSMQEVAEARRLHTGCGPGWDEDGFPMKRFEDTGLGLSICGF